MARRTYQAGHVFQKGRKKTDSWDPKAYAYGRYWDDARGERQRHVLCLGKCRTRSLAVQACLRQLDQLGINSTQHFIETTSSTTFKQQGDSWLRSLATRKRNPLEQTTIDTRRYALDKWMYPRLGALTLGDVNNHAMKALVEEMSATLSPATIRDYTNIVKDVVASAIDERGEEQFPRKWNEEYIDAPVIANQRQPSVDSEGVERIIRSAGNEARVLYALLAGCGPLRAGEALGLEVGHVHNDFRTLVICQKAKRGLVQPFLKTKAGAREVDLPVPLAEMLREYVGERRTGLLFHTASGRQRLQTTILRDSLHPILRKLGLPQGGFNIFRRFRLTHLKMTECPEVLRHYWAGHSQQSHVEERYIKILANREWRIKWAGRVGLGFTLGQPGQLIEFRNTA